MLKRLQAHGPAAVETMTKAHQQWWREFWSKSQIDIPSEEAGTPPGNARRPDGKRPEMFQFQTTPGTTYGIYPAS